MYNRNTLKSSPLFSVQNQYNDAPYMYRYIIIELPASFGRDKFMTAFEEVEDKEISECIYHGTLEEASRYHAQVSEANLDGVTRTKTWFMSNI